MWQQGDGRGRRRVPHGGGGKQTRSGRRGSAPRRRGEDDRKRPILLAGDLDRGRPPEHAPDGAAAARAGRRRLDNPNSSPTGGRARRPTSDARPRSGSSFSATPTTPTSPSPARPGSSRGSQKCAGAGRTLTPRSSPPRPIGRTRLSSKSRPGAWSSGSGASRRSRSDGVVRVNSILPACASGRGRAPLFLLMNSRRARPDSTPKMAYTYLP